MTHANFVGGWVSNFVPAAWSAGPEQGIEHISEAKHLYISFANRSPDFRLIYFSSTLAQ